LSLIISNIGNCKVFKETCNSTNNELKLLLQTQQIGHGTVLYTNYQTAGRGQSDNIWSSSLGKNVLMSAYLRPPIIAPDMQAYLNMLISLSVRDAMQQFIKEPVYIKWPNDIIAENHKLGGILVENTIQQNRIKYTIAGIGINVNQTKFNGLKATSLKLLTGKSYYVLAVINCICIHLDKYYIWLIKKQFDKILNEYTHYLYTRGTLQTFEVNNKKIAGKIMGVSNSGKLYVMIEDEIKSYGHKEISLIY